MPESEFEVDNWMDQVRRSRRPGDPRFRRKFATEDEAKVYIIARAEQGVLTAMQDVARAQARLKKCQKKFGTPTYEEAPNV